jgi:serine/threonine protein kinase
MGPTPPARRHPYREGMRIVKISALIAPYVLNPEKHPGQKLFRHAIDRVVGTLPLPHSLRHLRNENVDHEASLLKDDFIREKSQRVLRGRGDELLQIANRPGVTDGHKRQEIVTIVTAEMPDAEGDLKIHAKGINARGAIRRQVRFVAREDAAPIHERIALAIWQQVRPPEARLDKFKKTTVDWDKPWFPRLGDTGKQTDDRTYSMLSRTTSAKSTSTMGTLGFKKRDITRTESPKTFESNTKNGNTTNSQKIIINREYSDDSVSSSSSLFQPKPRKKINLERIEEISIAPRKRISMDELKRYRTKSSIRDPIPELDILKMLPAEGLVLGRVLGAGSMGTAYTAKLREGSAISECVVKKFKRHYWKDLDREADLNMDIDKAIASSGGRPHIARFLGTLSYKNNLGEEEPLLAFEYIRGHQLGSLFNKLRPILSTVELLKLAQHVIHGVVTGLAAIEDIGLAHNDIKPDNILFDLDTMTSKLLDFGNAERFGKYRRTGSLPYTPPERVGAVPGMSLNKPLSGSTSGKLEARELNFIEGKELYGQSSLGYLYASEWDKKDYRAFKDDLDKGIAPVNHKTDAFSMGQTSHYLVEGKEYFVFTEKVDNDFRLLWLLSQNVEKFRRQGQVFAPKEMTDRHKFDMGYYDFVNRAMDPNYDSRRTCKSLLEEPHPFLQNLPSEDEIRAIVAKLEPSK